jgi:hypothetical protein
VLSRFAAIWIVALILLPFTAPFPTCDIADCLGRRAPDQRVPVAPPTSSAALIVDAESSLLVPPVARMARLLKQAALADLNTPQFGFRPPLVILVPPVGSDRPDTVRPPSTPLRC